MDGLKRLEGLSFKPRHLWRNLRFRVLERGFKPDEDHWESFGVIFVLGLDGSNRLEFQAGSPKVEDFGKVLMEFRIGAWLEPA